MFLFFWNFLQQVMFAFFFEADYLPIVLLKLLFLLYLELQHNQLVLLVQLHVCKYNSSGFDYNCKHEIIVVVLTSGSIFYHYFYRALFLLLLSTSISSHTSLSSSCSASTSSLSYSVSFSSSPCSETDD